MGFKQIKSESVVQQIINAFTDEITNGDLKPGDKLPTEMKLAEKFGVGRNSVREAVKIKYTQDLRHYIFGVPYKWTYTFCGFHTLDTLKIEYPIIRQFQLWIGGLSDTMHWKPCQWQGLRRHFVPH